MAERPGLTIFGVTGRMGQSLLRALAEDHVQLRLNGAIASPHSSRLGMDAALNGAPTGVRVTADPVAALAGAMVAVDFSVPQSVAANVRACVAARVPLLLGTTGFDDAARVGLDAAAALIPLLIAPNTSVGVAAMMQLVELAARLLGEAYDVEIGEAHHRLKRDAPSGTALALGQVVAHTRGRRLSDVAVFDRHGVSRLRTAGDIGFAVQRAGDIVGDHTVTFAVAGERLEITHRATDRVMFARGALRAAAWLAARPAGLYTMIDALGLDQP